MVAQQLLETCHNDLALLLNAAIEGHRLCIAAQACLQMPVHTCTHTHIQLLLHVVNLLCALMTMTKTNDDAARRLNVDKLEVTAMNIRTAMHTMSLAVVHPKRHLWL